MCRKQYLCNQQRMATSTYMSHIHDMLFASSMQLINSHTRNNSQSVSLTSENVSVTVSVTVSHLRKGAYIIVCSPTNVRTFSIPCAMITDGQKLPVTCSWIKRISYASRLTTSRAKPIYLRATPSVVANQQSRQLHISLREEVSQAGLAHQHQ